MSEVESAILDNARTELRHGGLNQKDAPGIRHVQALLLEEKRNGSRQTSNEQMFSLSGLSNNPGICVLEDVKRFQSSDLDLADLAEQERIWAEATAQLESRNKDEADLKVAK